jgi:hypothetical protein
MEERQISALLEKYDGRSFVTDSEGNIVFSDGEILKREDIDDDLRDYYLLYDKQAKIAEINTEKKKRQLQPVEVRGIMFNGGREAGQKYDEAFRLAKLMGRNSGMFGAADGSLVEVDEAFATEVVVAIGAMARTRSGNMTPHSRTCIPPMEPPTTAIHESTPRWSATAAWQRTMSRVVTVGNLDP